MMTITTTITTKRKPLYDARKPPSPIAAKDSMASLRQPSSGNLPLFPSPHSIPNNMLQLFGTLASGPRKYLDKTRIPAAEGMAIRYTGYQLNQGDLDVYLAILHLANLQRTPLGTPVYIEDWELLGFMGRSSGGSDLTWLNEVCTRLKANEIEVELDASGRYGASLLQSWYHDKERRMTAIILDPLLQALLNQDRWTGLHWEQRLALKGHQLAQWLHAFHATHETSHPYNADELWTLCGGESPSLTHFKSELGEALSALETATGWHCGMDAVGNILVEKASHGHTIDLGLPCHTGVHQ